MKHLQGSQHIDSEFNRACKMIDAALKNASTSASTWDGILEGLCESPTTVLEEEMVQQRKDIDCAINQVLADVQQTKKRKQQEHTLDGFTGRRSKMMDPLLDISDVESSGGEGD